MFTKIISICLAAFCSMFLFSGCVLFQNDARVTSFADKSAFPQKFRYTIEPGSGSAEDLEYRSYLPLVEEMLAAKDFELVSANDANCVVKFYCGTDTPERVYSSMTSPVYGQVGYVAGRRGDSRHYTRPVYGVVGYETQVSSQYLWTHFFVLECWAANFNKDSGKQELGKQLWKTRSFCSTDSADLREMFPLLALASFHWIAEDSGKMQEISEFSSQALEKLYSEMGK